MMATAFMGYVLPWGQMSFWGATVITNLFSAIPYVGESIVTLLWGGFSVDNATLNRFFSLHYLMPFIIAGVVVLHIVALHRFGSNNPIGIDTKGPQDTISFHPTTQSKTYLVLPCFFCYWQLLSFSFPNAMGHPDNYIPANAMQTPAHIVPEWYFLPFYAILRAVPDKLGGVLLMFGAIAVLFILPWLDKSPVRSARFRPIFRIFFWIFSQTLSRSDILVGSPLRYLRSTLAGGNRMVFHTFSYYLAGIGMFETTKPLPKSIAEPVLGGFSSAPDQAYAAPRRS